MSIATTSIKMTLSAAGVLTGLQKLQGGLNSFGSSVAYFGKAALGIGAVLTAISGGAGFVSMVHSTIEAIDRLDELSQKTGISTEALSRLGYAAKFSSIDTETLSDSLVKMERALGDSTGKAGNIFQGIGLDAKKLAAESPDQAFEEIADAINALPDPASKATAAMEIFGKSGANLLPLLAEGSEGLKKFAQESDNLGTTVKDADAVKVARLADNITKFQAAAQGAINTLVIQAAPFVTALLEKITNWLTEQPHVIDFVVTAFQTVLECIATGADYLQLFNAGLKYLQSAAAAAFGSMIGAIADVGDALNVVLGSSIAKKLFGDITVDTSAIRDMANGLDDLSGELYNDADAAYDDFANGVNAAKVDKFFDDIKTNADKQANAAVADRNTKKITGVDIEKAQADAEKLSGFMEKLQTSVRDFGLTDSQKTILDVKDLTKDQGTIKQAQDLVDQLDKLEAGKKLDDAAKQVLEDIQTPAEKAQAEIAKLDELLDSGRLTWDEYNKAVAKVNDSLDDHKDVKLQGPELLDASSQHTKRVLLDFQRNITPEEDKHLAEEKKQSGFLEKIMDNTATIGKETVEKVRLI